MSAPLDPSDTGAADSPEPTAGLPLPVMAYAPASLNKAPTLPPGAVIAWVCSVAVYAIVCIPAYGRDTWPPRDRALDVLPWVWVFAVPLLVLLLPPGGATRKALLFYALLSGAIDASTFPYVNTRHNSRINADSLFENAAIALPAHLVITLAAAWVSFYLFRISRNQSPWKIRLPDLSSLRFRIIATAVTLGLAALFCIGGRAFLINRDWRLGVKIANADWTSHTAGILYGDGSRISSDDPDSMVVFHYVDDDSGLSLREGGTRYWRGYNAQIKDLLALEGVPAWARQHVPASQKDLLTIFARTDMQKVDKFPCVLSPSVVIFNSSGTTPWGTYYNNPSNEVVVLAANQSPWRIRSMLRTVQDATFVTQLPKYPGIFFVRCGYSVVECSADGWVLQHAMKFP